MGETQLQCEMYAYCSGYFTRWHCERGHYSALGRVPDCRQADVRRDELVQ